MTNSPTFRERVFEKLKAALGEPEGIHSACRRSVPLDPKRPQDLKMYVTMGSPEWENIAHVMISDGLKYQDKPVESVTVYTMEDADRLVERIVAQWKGKREC